MSFLRRPLGEAAAVTALLAVFAAVFARNLHTATSYDEGVYLASLDALRGGAALGSEVFASQPPGFYLLLRLIGLFSGHSVTAARTGFVILALVGIVGAYALGRALAGVLGGLIAAGLVAIIPPYAGEAIRVTADLPAASLTLVALASAAWAVKLESPWLAAAAGAVFACAVSVKLDALIALLPLVLLFLTRRPSRRVLLATACGAATVTVAFLIAYADVLGDLWGSVVTFHRDARVYPSDHSNGEVIGHFLDFTTPSAWLVVLGALAAALARRRGRPWWLWIWPVAAALFLLWQKPLFDQHLVLLSAALGTAAGVALGRLPTAVVVVVLLGIALGAGQQYHQIKLAETAEPAQLRWGEDRLRHCTEPVGSDEPIVVFGARARTPGQLVDTSKVRFATGSLTTQSVLEIVDRYHLSAMYVDRAFLEAPEIIRGLDKRFGKPRRKGSARLYASASCAL
jgi:dolichyl-phosphate-mannose-protein mannosyltransferase